MMTSDLIALEETTKHPAQLYFGEAILSLAQAPICYNSWSGRGGIPGSRSTSRPSAMRLM